MSSTEAPFSYTEKTAAGNLFTVRGADYDEFFGNLVAVRDDPELVEVLAGVHNKLGAAAAVASVDQGNARQSGYRRRATYTPAPAEDSGDTGGGGACQHGNRVAKSGEKNGRHWSGWFCPNSDRMCAPVWNR